MNPKVLPAALAVIDAAAAVVYLFHRDWLHAIYWLCAAGLTTTVTLLP